MMEKRDAEDNSETPAGTPAESGQSQQILSETERQLRIGRTIMQEYRSTLSALAIGEVKQD